MESLSTNERKWPALDWAIEICFLAVLFCLPFKDHTRIPREAGLALAFIMLLVRRFCLRDRSVGIGPYGWALGAILAAGLASAALAFETRFPESEDRFYSFDAFRKHLLHFIVFFWVAAQVARRPGAVWRAAGVFAASGGLSAVLGILGYRFWGWIDDDSSRATGTYESYSRSAMMFIFWIPVVLGMLPGAWRRWKPAAVGLCAVLGVGVVFLLLTQTRGAWIAVAAAALAWAAIRKKWIALAIIIVVPVAIVSFHPPTRSRARTMIRDSANMNLLLSGRIEVWGKGWPAIRDNPVFGLGYGPDVYQQEKTRETYPLLTFHQEPDLHNVYLQQLAEVGAIGVIAYLFFFVVFVRQTARATMRLDDSTRNLALGFWLALGAILLYGLVGNFYESRNGMLFWWVLGTLAGMVWDEKRHGTQP